MFYDSWPNKFVGHCSWEQTAKDLKFIKNSCHIIKNRSQLITAITDNYGKYFQR